MKKTSVKVNVEKITASIRRDIAKRASAGDIERYRGAYQGDGLSDNLDVLRSHYKVATWRPLRSDRLLGRLIVLFRKIIRKCIMFYVVPIVIDQNENNRIILECLEDLSAETIRLRERVEELER